MRACETRPIVSNGTPPYFVENMHFENWGGRHMLKPARIAFLATIVSAGALYAPSALAGAVNLVLVRGSLDNDTDPNSSGLWQYEGGTIQNATTGATIGHYIVTRRVTTSGTSADNTAAETMTLFFPNATAGNVPNNLTLQGAYSYNTGQFTGSVSAVSSRYRLLNGLDFSSSPGTTAGTTKLTIDYTGINSVP